MKRTQRHIYIDDYKPQSIEKGLSQMFLSHRLTLRDNMSCLKSSSYILAIMDGDTFSYEEKQPLNKHLSMTLITSQVLRSISSNLV